MALQPLPQHPLQRESEVRTVNLNKHRPDSGTGAALMVTDRKWISPKLAVLAPAGAVAMAVGSSVLSGCLAPAVLL